MVLVVSCTFLSHGLQLLQTMAQRGGLQLLQTSSATLCGAAEEATAAAWPEVWKVSLSAARWPLTSSLLSCTAWTFHYTRPVRPSVCIWATVLF